MVFESWKAGRKERAARADRRSRRQTEFAEVFEDAKNTAIDKAAITEAVRLGTEAGQRIAKERSEALAQKLAPEARKGTGRKRLMDGLMKAGKNALDNMGNTNTSGIGFKNPLLAMTEGFDPTTPSGQAVRKRAARAMPSAPLDDDGTPT